jgi:hypothetical protein
MQVMDQSSASAGFVIELFEDIGSGREQFERELLALGEILPLSHRCVWPHTQRDVSSWFLGIRDQTGRALYGFAIDVHHSRALPGHLILRVERFGPSVSPEAKEAGVRALSAYAKKHFWILRVHVEVFSHSMAIREDVADIVSNLGFTRNVNPRMYAKTVAIDLRSDETQILAGLGATARRHIRAASKHPVGVQPIEDPRYAQQMTALHGETMKRTGGRADEYDWSKIIELSRDYPQLSRITGVFRTDIAGPDSLLAFAWGRFHGDNVDYAVAASTRTTNLKIPLGYAAAWDLMRWAKANGATWFDFGGITSGSHGNPADPLGGISDFKRSFSKNVVRVGEEWVLEPNFLRAQLANTISSAARWVRDRFKARVFKWH